MNNNQKLEAIKQFIGDEINKVNTAVAGTIVDYDPSTNRATVKPFGTVKFEDDRRLPYPNVYNVPIVFPTSMGGTCGVTFPIKNGDGCLLVFSQDNMDEYLTGKQSDESRKYQLTDCIAIMGLYTNATDGQINKSNSLCLFYGGSMITLDDSGFIGKLADGTNFNFSGGDLVVNGISLTKHVHGGVIAGGADTAKPK